MARYRWPTMSSWFEKILKPAPTPLASQFVLSAVEKADSGEHSLAYKLQNSDGAFPQVHIAAECLNHLAAGIDTTGDALCFLMYQLSLPRSFQVQDQLIAELLSNKEKSLDDLPYLEAVIKEGLRCFPPIPMSQPRYVPKDGRIIDGCSIPAGVIVSCQAWSVHQLNENVFVRGDQFLPERWLDPQACVEMNRLFFAFSAGGRSCTGKHLALIEMKCLLREVYSRYKTRIAPEMTGSMALSDQAISTRPLDQTCKLIFEPIG
ncbi:Cytochrome P450 monooxygenase [Hyphodiscus hymeniophilus]|uniref:Cytochrome P450 monooxygenase n=1 Tax=Hyphodiscus hymeniophilus TaxID=353542 RepID=A0A9P7AYR1_9HELO|nr:Cytochrome P450 monooxygenase [Hyphodiscus hymeniophilus]